MTRNLKSTAAGLDMWAFDNVHFGTIVLQKIEINCRELGQRIAQIANDRNGFQKYFGQDHGRTKVQIYATLIEPAISVAATGVALPRKRKCSSALCPVRRCRNALSKPRSGIATRGGCKRSQAKLL